MTTGTPRRCSRRSRDDKVSTIIIDANASISTSFSVGGSSGPVSDSLQGQGRNMG